MPEITKTIKLHLNVTEGQDLAFQELTNTYKDACNFISEYVFANGFELNSFKLQKVLYTTIREKFGLKSQITTATFKTVTARYQTVQTQLIQNPYKYKNENGEVEYTQKTLDWMQKPLVFSRPQCDLNHGRDYAFLQTGKLSVNTMKNRALVGFDFPHRFKEYFDGTWKLGTAKLVKLNGDWYLHIPAARKSQTNWTKLNQNTLLESIVGYGLSPQLTTKLGKPRFLRQRDGEETEEVQQSSRSITSQGNEIGETETQETVGTREPLDVRCQSSDL